MKGINCPQFYVLLKSCEMRNEKRSLIVSQNLLFVVFCCQNQKMECFMKKKCSFLWRCGGLQIEAFVSFGVSRLSHFLLKDIEKWCTWSWSDFWAHCDESIFTQCKCYFGERVFLSLDKYNLIATDVMYVIQNFSIFLKSTWSGSLVKQSVMFRCVPISK